MIVLGELDRSERNESLKSKYWTHVEKSPAIFIILLPFHVQGITQRVFLCIVEDRNYSLFLITASFLT